MRQRLAIKSSAIGLSTKMITMALSFYCTRLFMQYLGVEIRGISELLANVLGLLQLAETGIGTAIVYALYQPLVDNNKEEIKSLMAFYKKAYNYIGILVAILGGGMSFFLKAFITDATYQWDYIYVIYFIQLSISVSTYLVGAYKRNLLYADQKQYITTTIDALVNVFCIIIRIYIIINVRSYVLYLLVQLLQTIVSNLIVGVVVDKKFPYLKEKVVAKYDKMEELFTNVKNVVIGGIGGIIYSSTDNLIISRFVGISAVGYMANYYTITTFLVSIVSSITGPIRPMLGNLIRENDDKKKVYNIFLSYTFIRYFIANVLVVGVVVMMNPLIELWLGKEYAMTLLVPLFLAIDMFIAIVHGPTGEFISVLGLFRNDRNMTYVAIVINIVTSVFFVHLIGPAGVLLGTVITQCYYWIARTYIVFKKYFKEGIIIYIRRVFSYCLLTIADILLMAALRNMLMPTTNIISFLVLCVLSVLVSVIGMYIVWGRSEEYLFMKGMIARFISRKSTENN